MVSLNSTSFVLRCTLTLNLKLLLNKLVSNRHRASLQIVSNGARTKRRTMPYFAFVQQKKRGLPIPLMHPAFCDFTRQFHEPLLDDDTAVYLNMANKLCEAMPSAFDSESDRLAAFEEIFILPDIGLFQHLEFPLSAKVSTAMESGARLDVAKSIPFKEGHLLLLLLKEFEGETLGDVYMQICRAYEVLCGETRNAPLLKFGNPVFLLCVLGRYQNVDPE
jgi:hypothetical protein